jgi:tight adherence protein B
MLLYIAGSFILVAGLITGAYYLLVLVPEGQEQDAVRKRLGGQRKAKAAEAKLLRDREALSKVEFVDRILTGFTGITDPLQVLIQQAGLKMTVATLLLMCAGVGLGVALLVQMFFRVSWIAIPLGIAAAPIPILVVRRLRTRRLLKFEEQFPEAIDLIARALRAGHALTTGLSMTAQESPQPVGGEFRALYEQQNFGMPLPDALRAFARRIPVLDAQFFATAVLTQRETGGNLSEVLDNLASVIRERFRVKRQVRVISAHGRLTGFILTALPPGLAAAFMIINPNHVRMLLNDPLGLRMIAGAIVLQLLGGYIISRIVKVEY